jgi:hypothetical protein
MRVPKKCASYGCTRAVVAKGLCSMHYNRERVIEMRERPPVPERQKWEYIGRESELIAQAENEK